jgi:hypothetical protein
MTLTLDERVEIVLLSGVRAGPRSKWGMSLMPDILNYRLLCYCLSQYVEQNPHKRGKAAEKMRRVSGEHIEDIM